MSVIDSPDEAKDTSNGWVVSRTASDFLAQQASTKPLRTILLRALARTLEENEDPAGFEKVAARIRARKLDPTIVGNKMIALLMKEEYAPSTISYLRTLFGTYLKFLVPDIPEGLYKPTEVQATTLNDVVTFEREEVKALLEKANQKYKAFIGISVNGGARISEVINILVRNIDFTKRPVVVKIIATKTESRFRNNYLSGETAQFVQDWLKSRDRPESEYLFPSPDDPTKAQDSHTSRYAIYQIIKAAGLDRIENGRHIYHPHTFRSTFLGLAKANGLTESYAEQIAGHNVGVKKHYNAWPEIEKAWVEKDLDAVFTFLDRASYQDVKSLRNQFEEAKSLVRAELSQQFQQKIDKVTNLIASKYGPNKDPGTKRFENHVYIYIKTTIGSDDYDQALAEGFEQYQTGPNGLVYLRKPKEPTA